MANAEPELAEIGTIVTSLKEGTTMTRFYSSRRPETRIFLLKLDEFQIAWWRNAGKEEGTGILIVTSELKSSALQPRTLLLVLVVQQYLMNTVVTNLYRCKLICNVKSVSAPHINTFQQHRSPNTESL